MPSAPSLAPSRRSRVLPGSPVVRVVLTLALLVARDGLPAQASAQGGDSLPTIEAHTQEMQKLDGFFPLYWDARGGRLFMEIPALDTEVLHVNGLGAGLGSNDIGLDRGGLQGSRIVEFERVGPKVLMVQPNYAFRSSSDSPAEVRAVRDAFARSVLWGFTAAAESGDRVLVDLSDFLIRDATNIAPRLRPGSYRLEASRSSVYMPMTMNFPENTEMEVELTFVPQPGNGGGGGGGGGGGQYFEGVGSVSATGEAASVRLHHSFVKLPDPGFTPRVYDPRSGFGSFAYDDYSTPLGESITQRFIRRHRLEKRDPGAAVSDPVEPIVYYLDPGVPEPVRSALLEGARWWNQAFEAAGYRDAFRVELLPEDVSSLDIRYNVINWVHRSTRGWSSGSSVTDPRTGEIIKGVVTLGSLRVRQDYMLFEGLTAPYADGDGNGNGNGNGDPAGLAEWSLARIRQLSAHEVGHTLGLGHNYYDSEAGRISVLDYPHPLVTLASDGSLDLSDVYDVGIGEWDEVAITWGYQDFPEGTDEQDELDRILEEAWGRDIRYMTNQDIEAHPRVDQWSNGTDAAAELGRMLAVRRAALSHFGEGVVRERTPLALLEEVLVPLYLHHRYQVDATASVLGGLHYIYALKGDGREPFRFASAAEQQAALSALMGALQPSELVLPRGVIEMIPPRPAGYGAHRELFPRGTGQMFDVVAPAVVLARMTMSQILMPERAARMVEQHALDPALPGLEQVIDQLFAATFGATARDAYEAEVKRAVERVVIEYLMALSVRATMPQVSAIATHALERRSAELARTAMQASGGEAAHRSMLARDVGRFLEDPESLELPPELIDTPPGAPIDPGMDWLGVLEPPCTWWEMD